MVDEALAVLEQVPTDLLQEMLAVERNPACAWVQQLELNRRLKHQPPWWHNNKGEV